MNKQLILKKKLKNAEGKRLLAKNRLEYCKIIIDAIQQNPTIINQILEELELSEEEFFNYISENTASADFNLESPSLMYEYLRLQTFKDPPIGSAIVGLIGYTKHENSNNCFKLSEVAEAVVPQMPIRADNIMSGVIAITPKTINATKLYSQKNKSIDNSLENGSLECAIIEYQKNPKTNAVQPTNIMNVCRAVEIVNDKAIPIKISSSSQPTDNLYIAKQIQDYVM